jgi:hypothetical protein
VVDGSGNVSQLTDKSGNGNHWAMATAQYRPKYNAAGINGLPSVDTTSGDTGTPYMFSVNTAAEMFGAATAAERFLVIQTQSSQPGEGVMFQYFGNSGGSYASYFPFGNGGTSYAEDFFSTTLYGCVPTSPYAANIVDSQSSGSAWMQLVNGTATYYTTSNTVGATSNPIAMFGNGFAGASLIFSEMLVFDRVLLATERRQVLAYLSARYGIAVAGLSPAKYQVIADGDSITAGYLVSPTSARFTDYSVTFSGGLVSDTNVASFGELFASMLSTLQNQGPSRLAIASAISAGSVPLLFCGGGINDIQSNGTSASALYTIAQEYFAEGIALGAAQTYGWTLPPTTNASTNAIRLAYNALLRIGYAAANIGVLIDPALDPQLQGNPGELSPDGLHWYAIAQPILANHWAPGVLSILGTLDLASISVASGPEAGGTTVTLSGTGIGNAQVRNVALAGMSAASFATVDANTIQAVTSEAFQPGQGDVTIYGPNGSATLPSAFTYD